MQVRFARACALVVVLLSSAPLLHVPAFLNARLRKRKLLLLLAMGVQVSVGAGSSREQWAVGTAIKPQLQVHQKNAPILRILPLLSEF